MNLFYLENTNVKVQPHTLLIRQFADVYNRDKSKDKSMGVKELAFIYFRSDYKSTYQSLPPDERESVIIEDVFGKESNWVPDQVVLNAVSKYEDLQQVPSMRLVKATRSALEELVEYFNNVDFDKRDSKGQPVYKLTEVTKGMGDTARIIESIEKLEEKVRKELQESIKARGGEASGIFEDHDM